MYVYGRNILSAAHAATTQVYVCMYLPFSVFCLPLGISRCVCVCLRVCEVRARRGDPGAGQLALQPAGGQEPARRGRGSHRAGTSPSSRDAVCVCMYVCVHVCMQLAFHPSPTWLRRLASQQSRDEYLREQTRHVALVRSHPHIYNMHAYMCCWNAAEMESMLGCSC